MSRERLAAELDELGLDELAADVRAGLCGCGCKEPIVSRHAAAVYANERHKQRAYRRRLEAAAAAAGVAPRVTMETVRGSGSTNHRNDDAHTAPSRLQRGENERPAQASASTSGRSATLSASRSPSPQPSTAPRSPARTSSTPWTRSARRSSDDAAAPLETIPGMTTEVLERVERDLTEEERAIARALRRSAKIVSAAGLPAAYRPAAFSRVAELELLRGLDAGVADVVQS